MSLSHQLIKEHDIANPLDAEFVALPEPSLLSAHLERQHWLNRANQMAPLPKRLNQADKYFIGSMSFALICGSMSVIVYADGSMMYGTLAVIGGIAVNLTQNIRYGKMTCDSFKDSLRNRQYLQLGINSFIGTLTAVPLVIAEFNFSHQNLFKTGATAIGNIPLNMVGVHKSWQRFYDHLNDNRVARDFLMDKLRGELACTPELLNALEKEYSSFVNNTGNAIGLGLGVVLGSAQICFVALIANFIFEKVWSEIAFAVTCGLVASMPTILISLLMSGKDIGLLLTQLTADLVEYMYEKIVHGHDTALFKLTTRDIAAVVTSGSLNIPLSFLALHSSGPAKNAYYSNMPEDMQNPYWDFCVNLGAVGFNAINSFLAIHSLVKNTQVAYTADDSLEKDQHRVRAIQRFFRKSPPLAINQFCESEASFSAEDKQAILPVERKQSACHWIAGFFYKKDNYQLVDKAANIGDRISNRV